MPFDDEIDIPYDGDDTQETDNFSSAVFVTNWSDVRQLCFDQTGLNVSESDSLKIMHMHVWGLCSRFGKDITKSATKIQRYFKGWSAIL